MRLNLPDRAAVCVSGVQKKYADEERVVYEFGCADTGIGMSETFLEHAFEPFTQENETKQIQVRRHRTGTCHCKRKSWTGRMETLP